MSDLLNEILNENKVAKRINLFYKILPLLVISALIIALSIGLYNWYINKQTEKRQESGDVLFSVLSDNYSNDDLSNSIDKLENREAYKQSELLKLVYLNNLVSSENREDVVNGIRILDEYIKKPQGFNEITNAYIDLLWFGAFLDKMNALDKMKYFEDNNSMILQNATVNTKYDHMFYSVTQLYGALYNYNMGIYDGAVRNINNLSNNIMDNDVHSNSEAFLQEMGSTLHKKLPKS